MCLKRSAVEVLFLAREEFPQNLLAPCVHEEVCGMCGIDFLHADPTAAAIMLNVVERTIKRCRRAQWQ